MIKNTTKFKETEIGTIPEEWDVVNIGDILSLEYGKALKDENRVLGEIPVYGSNGVVGYHNQKLVDGPGIIVGRKGSAGEVIFSNKDFFPIDTTYYVKTNFDNKYVYYLLKNTDIKQLVSSSAVPGLNRNDVYSQRIGISKSEQEQKQIAEILSSLDDKIELNRQINANLEKIASSLFKHWFVDFEFSFDFAQGRPDKNGKPYKTSGGKMIDSELGKIPEGWKVDDLGNFVNILNGFAFKSSDYKKDGIFLLRTSNFDDSGYANNNDTIFLPISFADVYKNYLLKKFDVLLVMVGASVGKMSFVTSRILPALQNQNMWNFRAINSENQLFIKFLIQNIVKDNIGSASGSARDFFRKDFFKKIKFIQPKQEIVIGFVNIILPMYEQIDKNILEIDLLLKTRDSLLPRLMNGKIRV